MRKQYSTPHIVEERQIRPDHGQELTASAIDFVTAAFCGVSSVDHEAAYDFGLRGGQDLSGLCFRYWDPSMGRFSERFVRVKLAVQRDGKRYLQPVGERPRLYFVAGTCGQDLVNTSLPVLITEGEKKALSLSRALAEIQMQALIVGIGGVWSWRYSPRELQPDGTLGKGKSQPIADLDLITWNGRDTYLLFDSDVATNWKVEVAETALAQELRRRGAIVRIVRIPGSLR